MNYSNIEWCEMTNNPIRGKCPHFGTNLCGTYCYAERIKKSSLYKEATGADEELEFISKELDAIRKRRIMTTIFIGSMIDLWADAIPDKWLKEIYDTALNVRHTVLFCTKNPSRYSLAKTYRDGIWFGASATDANKAENFCKALLEIKEKGAGTFLSVEPLLEPIANKLNPDAYDCIIIGAMTGPGAVKPEERWVKDIIDVSFEKPVFLKDNLLELFPELPRLRRTAWKNVFDTSHGRALCDSSERCEILREKEKQIRKGISLACGSLEDELKDVLSQRKNIKIELKDIHLKYKNTENELRKAHFILNEVVRTFAPVVLNSPYNCEQTKVFTAGSVAVIKEIFSLLGYSDPQLIVCKPSVTKEVN